MPATADEIEAAAGRLRRLATGWPPASVWPDPATAWAGDDLDTLAAAWLAEHPADDGEAIDAAWMDAVGGDDERGDGDRVWPIGPAAWLCVGLGGGVWHCWVRDGCGDGEDAATLPRLATRGQLRRLLAALGVPVADPAKPTPKE